MINIIQGNSKFMSMVMWRIVPNNPAVFCPPTLFVVQYICQYFKFRLPLINFSSSRCAEGWKKLFEKEKAKNSEEEEELNKS